MKLSKPSQIKLAIITCSIGMAGFACVFLATKSVLLLVGLFLLFWSNNVADVLRNLDDK